jgi:tetratricopeptide (TPR) repeat protein
MIRTDLMRATLVAMSGRIEEARALAGAAEAHARELGGDIGAIPTDPDIAEIESLAGDHQAAAERLTVWCGLVAEHGWSSGVGYYLGFLARELCLAGRYEEAAQRVAEAREVDERSPAAQFVWRQAAALVGSHRGEHVDAERLAREGLTHIEQTDSLQAQADAYFDLAEVLEAAGRRDEAIEAWSEALDRYERKGIVPLSRRVRERLAELQPA